MYLLVFTIQPFTASPLFKTHNMYKIIIFLLCVCFGLKNVNGQSIELGIGYTPIVYEGIEIHSFDGGDSGPSTNYANTVYKGVMPTLNLNLGMYFSLLNKTPEFSTGFLYQWITYVGKENNISDRFVYGLDLPVFACVRFGYTANENSNSNIGASFGAGAMYSMMGLSGTSAYDSRGVFTPAFTAAAIIRDVGGIQISSRFKGYQTYYQTNTGDIPRIKYTTTHISIYANLGTW